MPSPPEQTTISLKPWAEINLWSLKTVYHVCHSNGKSNGHRRLAPIGGCSCDKSDSGVPGPFELISRKDMEECEAVSYGMMWAEFDGPFWEFRDQKTDEQIGSKSCPCELSDGNNDNTGNWTWGHPGYILEKNWVMACMSSEMLYWKFGWGWIQKQQTILLGGRNFKTAEHSGDSMVIAHCFQTGW